MARADLLHQLAYRSMDPNKFDFDLIKGPPVLSMLSPYDVKLIDDISKDPRLVTKLDQRMKFNDQIMQSRGFVRMTQGTNRAVYKHLEDQSFVFKIAISEPGRKDSPAEMINQHKLRPFIAKCFDVVPNGVIGSFERVEDITSKEQFKNIAGEIFDMINKVVGNYVMADIGTKFFRNYGIRMGFGPVWLDYPMLFEVDGSKLFCNNLHYGVPCGGEIDYDPGFNFLYCEKCGKQYTASSLSRGIKNHTIEVVSKRRKRKMKIEVFEGDNKVGERNLNVQSSDTFVRNKRMEKFQNRKKHEKKEKELHVTDEGSEVVKAIMDSFIPKEKPEAYPTNYSEKEDNDEKETYESADEDDTADDQSYDYDNEDQDEESYEAESAESEADEVESDLDSDDDEYSDEEDVDDSDESEEDGSSSDEDDSTEGSAGEDVESDARDDTGETDGEAVDSSESEEDDERAEYIKSLTPEDFIQDLENIKELADNIYKLYMEDPKSLDKYKNFWLLETIADKLWTKYEFIKDKPISPTVKETEKIDLDSEVDPRDIHSPEELASKMSNY